MKFKVTNMEKGTAISLNFEYVADIGKVVSKLRPSRGSSSRFKSYEKKKMVLITLHLLRFKRFEMKLHMHMPRIVILMVLRYNQVSLGQIFWTFWSAQPSQFWNHHLSA